MSALAKTIVATGVSSGLGFEAIKQLLQQTQPYRVILGARNAEGAQKAFGDLKFDESKHNVTVLPLELADLRGVKTFAQQTLETLGQQKIDYVLLNAAISNSAEEPGPHGSKWCESYIVNHLYHRNEALTWAKGAENILRALERDDLPEDPEQIFLTSWGEWWPKEVYAQTLDKKLQDKWCLDKEQIEQEEGITA
ncbi:uncharacterized protein VDAG_03782 [Verticillium dahliae VdLs.17]|uniref:Short-chain dehydrogenase/reductase SDR n=1 Tax=Verticillium dahliae (strain VdLs.17 / ATCC MYA-4575 / FGSC 10137) TaxID=498257 RepID=G2X0K3_VERDV|nr:uncharacterized protein VDAG_03782 [Verticillium dahliae VdLs.17]EGY22344.1 hypothetical protein VDAG_03782 [Verticillium dahliae VdLs.17]